MSKAIYKFDLTDPDDRDEFLRTTKATEMAMILWEIIFNLRKRVGNSYDNISDEVYDKLKAMDGVHKVMDEIHKMLQESDINIDNLIR